MNRYFDKINNRLVYIGTKANDTFWDNHWKGDDSSFEKRIKAGYAPKDNEVDDWLFLPVVPYADLVLIDSNLREFILQADRSLESKVVCNMTDAVDILKTQTLTW